MTTVVLSSSSLCRGAHLWFFFFLFTSAFILLSVTVFVSSPLSQSLLSFWSVLLQFLSSLSPLFAPVLSSPSVADGVLCCQSMFFLLCNVFVEVLAVGNGWDEDGERWLWKPGTAAVFSSPLQRRCFFSWFPLFPLSTLFFPLYSSFMEVQMVGNGWDEDGERWLWKLGFLFLFSAAFCVASFQ